jgi:hypothetical protein
MPASVAVLVAVGFAYRFRSLLLRVRVPRLETCSPGVTLGVTRRFGMVHNRSFPFLRETMVNIGDCRILRENAGKEKGREEGL